MWEVWHEDAQSMLPMCDVDAKLAKLQAPPSQLTPMTAVITNMKAEKVVPAAVEGPNSNSQKGCQV